MENLVDLANFAETLPSWSSLDASHLHAIVDMGSNGIRFTISDLSPPQTRLLRCVYRERAGISLFDALEESPSGQLKLPADTITQVAQTLARFHRIALDFGVTPDHLCVFATEAMRRAANADALLREIARAAPGLAVYILAPAVETLFGSMGARAAFASIEGGLMLDLGGGSVQISYVDTRLGSGHETQAAAAGQSMPYGAARLTKLVLAAGVTSSASSSIEATAFHAAAPELTADLTEAIFRLQSQFPDLAAASAVDIYLCGGGFRGYGSMLMHNDVVQPYPIPIIGGYTVPGSFFKETRRMHRVHHAEPGKIFGLSKRRRQQFGAIAAVVDALVAAMARARLAVRTATFCAGGNREGALMMRLPPAVRQLDPLGVLAGCSSDQASVVEAVQSALPPEVAAFLPMLPLSLIVSRIWQRNGADDAANAAFSLHNAVHCEPGAPGLSHRVRAVLAIALWARWGGSTAPTDVALLEGLRGVLAVDRSAATAMPTDLVFWAEYVGAVAAAVALLCPAGARSELGVRFTPSLGSTPSGKKTLVRLHVAVQAERAIGLDLEDVEDCFGIVGKQHKKVKTAVTAALA